ncbi:MAG: Flagellar biosynthesis protein FliO [Frankiaceae bacterium]|nr:Flagellar biosynthesis protein FliO [Frankiaceae bacterium]
MLTALKMLMVFALLGGTLWYLRRHDRGALVNARRADRPVAVVAQARVGKTASVAVVRIGGENWAVGVTEQSVSLLVPEPVELDALSTDDDAAAADTAGSAGTAGTAGPALTAALRPTTPPTVRAFLGSLLGRRRRVEYLDVNFSIPPARAADGSARTPSARMPEQSIPR